MRTSPPSFPSLLWLALAGLAATAAQAQNTPSTPPSDTPSDAPPSTTAAPPATPDAKRPPAALERVEIRRATGDETAQRQQSTAAKTIVGREEIDRMGDATITEVLKRLPGVSIGGGRPGRGGSPRMRGLGSGYTQILINGERMPAGMSLDLLTPDQVERIEITRGPTAETGAQAIAGTINVILREDVRQRLNNVHLRLGRDDERWQPGVTWTRADQIDNFSYNLSANAGRQNSHDPATLDTVETSLGNGATTLDQRRVTDSRGHRDGLHLGGRLQWRLGQGESLALMPFLMTSSSHSNTWQHIDAVTGVPDFLQASQFDQSRFSLMRLNSQWQTRFDNGVRLDWKAGVTFSQSVSSSLRQESGAPATVSADGLRQVDDQRNSRDNWLSTSGKLSKNLVDGEHVASLGWELEQGRRNDTHTTLESTTFGVRDIGSEAGDNLQARTLRKALWVQDEWNVSPQWSLQGGLRWEGIDTHSDAADGSVSNSYGVLTPLMHMVWRPEEGGKDQVRLALTRSWRAPTLANLIARRTLATGVNIETNPDQAGNPQLKPELATGIDLAFEHYLAEGGVVSIGVFERHIRQLIRRQTMLEQIAGVSRWVSRPENIGNAVTRGIELEAKARLAELLSAAPPVELRANLSLFKSRVDSIVGPDNRLDQQPNWTANLGADWRVRGLPLTLGANIAQTPSYTVQSSNDQLNTTNTRQVVDAYALWAFSSHTQLRLSVNNLTARDLIATSAVTTASTLQTTTATTPSSTAWALRLEMKL